MATFNVEEKMVKDKTSTIPTNLKESNVMNVKDFGISKLNVQIFQENKEKVIMSPFRMMSLTKEVSMFKQIVL